MKRLFRTSKSTIDPLPPPTPPASDYAPQYQQQQQLAPQAGSGPKKSGSARLEGHGHTPAESLGGGGKNWFGGISAPSVTPFPVDVGHGGPMRRLSRKEKKERGSAPSMLEIQQMQQQSPAVLQKPPPPPPPKMESTIHHNPQSRFYETELASPDSSWTVLPPQQARHQPSPDHYSSRTHTPPLPVPSAPALQSGGGSGISSPNAQQLYLPPGARPPTPPAALRPATPNYISPMGQSEASLHSQQYEERRTRDRGYSSASGSMRGSDVESSTGHGGPKPVKVAPVQPMRSPLANSYASPPAFPTPQPHFQPPPAQYAPEQDIRNMAISQQYDEPPKEKKKFWGMDMDWAKKKDKAKDKDNLGVHQDQGRRSFDWSQAQDHSVGQTGYAVAAVPHGAMNMGSPMIMEDEQRGRMAGRMFFKDENKDPSSAKDVSAAIRK